VSLVDVVAVLLHQLPWSIDYALTLPHLVVLQLTPLLLLYLRIYLIKRSLPRLQPLLVTVLISMCKVYKPEIVYDPTRRRVYLVAALGVVYEEAVFRYGPILTAYILATLGLDIVAVAVLITCLTVGTAVWCLLHRYMRSRVMCALLATLHVVDVIFILHGLVLLPLLLHMTVNLGTLYVIRCFTTRATRLTRS